MTQTTEQARLNLRMRHRILKAATTLFIRNGFSGVSLGDVAKKLQINQSLIYHYFPSKEELWKAVKQPFLETLHEEWIEVVPLAGIGLRRFLENYLAKELDYWFHHAPTARLMRWCSLEESKTDNPPKTATDPLCVALEELQRQGLIASTLDLSVAAALVRSAVKGPFFCNNHAALRTASSREAYLRLIVEGLERLLAPP